MHREFPKPCGTCHNWSQDHRNSLPLVNYNTSPMLNYCLWLVNNHDIHCEKQNHHLKYFIHMITTNGNLFLYKYGKYSENFTVSYIQVSLRKQYKTYEWYIALRKIPNPVIIREKPVSPHSGKLSHSRRTYENIWFPHCLWKRKK